MPIGIWQKAVILEKSLWCPYLHFSTLRHLGKISVMSVFTFLDSPPSWKNLCDVSNYFSRSSAILEKICDVPNGFDENMPPSWKRCAMSLFTFLDPPPSWKKCVMSLMGLMRICRHLGKSAPYTYLDGVRHIPIWTECTICLFPLC